MKNRKISQSFIYAVSITTILFAGLKFLFAQEKAEISVREVSYFPNDELKLQGYLCKPTGRGFLT